MNKDRTRQRRLILNTGLLFLVIAMTCLSAYRAVYQERLNQALIDAAKLNDTPSIRRLLQQGADPNATVYIKDDRTIWRRLFDIVWHQAPRSEIAGPALCEAVDWIPPDSSQSDDNVEAVKVLLDAGAHLDVRDNLGQAPLIVAVTRGATGKRRVIDALLAHGADINIVGEDGFTPLRWAAAFGNLPVVKLLLRYHADTEAVNKDGDTALLQAAGNESGAAVETLLRGGANVAAANLRHETALEIACAPNVNGDRHRTIQALLSPGASVTVKASNGLALLQQARQLHDLWLERALKRAGTRN